MCNTDLYNKVSDIVVDFLLFTKYLAFLSESNVEESLAKDSKTVRLSKLVLNVFS